MNKLLAMFCCMGATMAMQGEIPQGYYDSCEGKTGNDLLKALSAKVSNHTNVGYDGLWNVYKDSDVRPDGTLWDIYSTKAWPSNFKQCGNYKLVGDCVNREHSFPKSWWGGGKATQYSDAYHLYPTDGKVNGQRSNFPYGECAGGSTVASNGNVKALGKLGNCTFPGYTGKVFEPDDEYKGDLARTYFYLAAAYNSSIAKWTSKDGANVMAGNSYPVFKQWTIDLLLKWSRQDPVSDKEMKRNEGVSLHQHNRNPFIDHPELVEYIWGNKVGLAWYADASTEPQIISPADGSSLNLGLGAAGVSRSVVLTVKGCALEENVRVSVAGNGFSATPATLAADDVNGEGADLTITYLSTVAGAATGTLTLTLASGDVTNRVTLSCRVMDGLPLGEPYNITDESFDIDWTCLDSPENFYTLDVMLGSEHVQGYPRSVRAGDEHASVEGLQPETTYTCRLSSAALTSQERTATTLAPLPSVEIYYDGTLEFLARPGEPSEVAEIMAVLENIAGNVTISVNSPFELSIDKNTWSRTIELQPEEERFYMRLFGNTEGEYSTPVSISSGDFFYDDVEAAGTISAMAGAFHEDFEAKGSYNSYGEKTYAGTACRWTTNALLVDNGDQAHPHEGAQAARTGKAGNGHLTMDEVKAGGMGTVSFWATVWGNDSDASFDLDVSSDGKEWENVGTVKVERNSDPQFTYREYTVPVNRKGNLRMRLNQTSGQRVLIDDMRITDYNGQDGVTEANRAEYHSWDAYCLNGSLILESSELSDDFARVYNIEGEVVYSDKIPAGTTELKLPAGVYIVVVRDFSRKVLLH